jgi:hypothetical protein
VYNSSAIVGILTGMVKQLSERRITFLVFSAYLGIALVIGLGVMREFRLDDSFITYRYARNFAEGYGLVYNVGEAVLSTTAPLYALLLGVLGIFVRDFHLLGSMIGVVSIGMGGGLIEMLLPRKFPRWMRVWGGLVYVLSSPLWLALGMETAFWIALVLGAMVAGLRGRWGWAGLLVGMAALARPDAALPGALLGLVALWTTFIGIQTRSRWWWPVMAYVAGIAALVTVFVLWATITYGSPIPVTLGAKSAQAALGISGMGLNIHFDSGLTLIVHSLMLQSPLYVALALLMVFGLASSLMTPVRLVAGWGALHFVAYVVMGVAPYRWYYAPLVPGVVMLAACGLYFIHERLRDRKRAAGTVLVMALSAFPLVAQVNTFERIVQQMREGGPTDVMLPIVDWDAYRQTGEWIDAHVPADATVGVAEVGQLGFYARRWMTDYLGLLQPDVAASLRRGDLYSWLAHYAPDYMVFQRFRGAPIVLFNYVVETDPWFAANYAPIAEFDDPRYVAGPVTVFERRYPVGDFQEQPVQLDYEGLRLTGLALDSSNLTTAGGMVRVRLDWQVTGELPNRVRIAVKGFGVGGGNPGFVNDYPTAQWHGQFSTWHAFVVPPGVETGSYILLVGVSTLDGPNNDQGAGRLDIPPAQPQAGG